MPVNTIPPWVRAADEEQPDEVDLTPDDRIASLVHHAPPRSPRSPPSHHHHHVSSRHAANEPQSRSWGNRRSASLLHMDGLDIPRAESPEAEDSFPGPAAPTGSSELQPRPQPPTNQASRRRSYFATALPPPTSPPRSPKARHNSSHNMASSSTPAPPVGPTTPQTSNSSNPVRARFHRLRERFSEYADDAGAVSEDYDTNYEDISDDEIHQHQHHHHPHQQRSARPTLGGRRGTSRRLTRVSSQQRKLERSRSLEQTRFGKEKDEWLTATLRLSPAERHRLGHEIRDALANSGTYWAKRRQRRKLRQQMRSGGGGSDPHDSFQPMILALEALQTFGTKAFTGHDPPKHPAQVERLAPIQNPNAPLPPVSVRQPSDAPSSPPATTPMMGIQHRPHFSRNLSHGIAPSITSGHSFDTTTRPNNALITDHSPIGSHGTFHDPQQQYLRMIGHHPLNGSGLGERNQGWTEKDVFTRRKASDDRWNEPWKPQMHAGLLHVSNGWPDDKMEDDTGFGYGYGSKGKGSKARFAQWGWWRNFLLHHPFTPLFVRFSNIVITTITLAVAIRLRTTLHNEHRESIVGVSPLLGTIFSPLTLAHIFFQVWLEYFGRPIGLWSVRAKLFGTSIEIIFVGMWSAEMALSWDNYYTTPNDDLLHKSRGYVRRLQCFLIGLSFISLFAYMITLIVRGISLSLLLSILFCCCASYQRD